MSTAEVEPTRAQRNDGACAPVTGTVEASKVARAPGRRRPVVTTLIAAAALLAGAVAVDLARPHDQSRLHALWRTASVGATPAARRASLEVAAGPHRSDATASAGTSTARRRQGPDAGSRASSRSDRMDIAGKTADTGSPHPAGTSRVPPIDTSEGRTRIHTQVQRARNGERRVANPIGPVDRAATPQGARLASATRSMPRGDRRMSDVTGPNSTGLGRGEAAARHDSKRIDGVLARAATAAGERRLDMALVFDSSRHVHGAALHRLRDYADGLLGLVERLGGEAKAGGHGKAGEGGLGNRFALVPYAAMVNVGSHNRDAGWLDRRARSPLHSAGFAAPVDRLQLLDDLGIGWSGCVEAPAAPHDTTIAAAGIADPGALFVPAFAVDEPDVLNGGGDIYANDWLDDSGGACPVVGRLCASWDTRGRCQRHDPVTLDRVAAQSRLCKYQHAKPRAGVVAAGGKGPGFACTSTPVMPLGTQANAIRRRLAAVFAAGDGNVAEGFTWGWRVLTEGAPLGPAPGAPAAAGSDRRRLQLLVLLTSGRNSWTTLANHNRSRPGAHGYAADERLGTDLNEDGLAYRLDARLATACANASASGLAVLVVVAGTDLADVGERLRACTSDQSDLVSLDDDTAVATNLAGASRRLGLDPRRGG